MIVVSFFNNKGGVGKTTLSINIASFIAFKYQKKVLFIDADPQSNSTQNILNDDYRDDVYKKDSDKTTLLSYLQPLLMGEPEINKNNRPLLKETNRFNFELIPGHPRVSLIEDILSEAWTNCNGGKIGGFRITNWLTSLKSIFDKEYDLLFIDLGPSLGALNRSILLNSDYFISPMGCDIFSLMGIENIATWIYSWQASYVRSVKFLEESYPKEKDMYPITLDISNKFRFLGFSVQQYITKVIGGERRGIRAYEEIMVEIPSIINRNLSWLFPKGLQIDDLVLGNIPHLYSLVPLAQSNHCPIHDLKTPDGIVGNHFKMVRQYSELMEDMCIKLLRNMGELYE
ncbi:ParA family protein [Desulfoscipio gibsoniae]|uniref:ATPase involved in chromosome partitioning n=1 Tax=Desulfoscipio gibsoniae DSM 7213 TaxID=767817 RepID=R4KWB0_9FIRM|nr:AAA family ATPase [Desulfoscipio gibsoniae]AGL03906.1 ATPase involved in chromosome partitioning [Desulfoscipio gibsoniae DSM 7213]